MKQEDKVCSLKLSMQLRGLGVKQKSLFYWDYDSENCYAVKFMPFHCPGLEHYSAFTADELGEMLPNHVTIEEEEPFNNFCLVIRKFNSVDEELKLINNYTVNYECDTFSLNEIPLPRRLTNNVFDKNLANAMASMILFLVENKLMVIPNEI